MANLQKPTGAADKIDALLDWPQKTLPTLTTLLALRRRWMAHDFTALRAQYEQLVSAGQAPQTQAEAEPLIQSLASASSFQFMHRHIQDRTWRLCEKITEARSTEIQAALQPDATDLGTLEADEQLAYPAYYTFDYHRQAGGIWRDDAAAAVYLLGARIVHVGRNSDFQLHDQFVDEIELSAPPERILDLGCGFGKTTFSLKRRWPEAEVEGIDLSLPCLKLGQKMATGREQAIRWRQADMEALPVADNSVDLAVITMVLHEMPEAAIRNSFTEAWRVLRPGGKLITLENRLIGDPFRDTLLKWYSELIDEPYWEPFRHLDIEELARDQGFQKTRFEKWYLAGTDGPAAEADPRRWCTPWGQMIAEKGSL
jgi:ubiquinone/menaquinone biosynthesis C-methylase UbiE